MSDSHGEDVFHHIRDGEYLELPQFLGGNTAPFPKIPLFGYELQLTKFMLLQVLAGLIVLFIFTGLARHIRRGSPARGRFWNFWEMLALAIRDQVVRPTIGTGHHGHGDDHGHDDHGHGELSHAEEVAVAHGKPLPMGAHPADKFLPFIWTCFFYVLFCNLLGAVPWLGSATGHLSVTIPLAITALLMVIFSGSLELGAGRFWTSLVPSMELPGYMAPLKLLIWVIEFVGLLVKHIVLAMRLFLNIMGGHTVIGVILGFIAVVGHPQFQLPALYWVVTPASVLGQVGIGLLELFVAFLQAYVFAFLTTLFIGSAVHPH